MDRQDFRTTVSVEIVDELSGVHGHQVGLHGMVAKLPQDFTILAAQSKQNLKIYNQEINIWG